MKNLSVTQQYRMLATDNQEPTMPALMEYSDMPVANTARLQKIVTDRSKKTSVRNNRKDPIKHAALDLKVLFDTYFKKPTKRELEGIHSH